MNYHKLLSYTLDRRVDNWPMGERRYYTHAYDWYHPSRTEKKGDLCCSLLDDLTLLLSGVSVLMSRYTDELAAYSVRCSLHTLYEEKCIEHRREQINIYKSFFERSSNGCEYI